MSKHDKKTKTRRSKNNISPLKIRFTYILKRFSIHNFLYLIKIVYYFTKLMKIIND